MLSFAIRSASALADGVEGGMVGFVFVAFSEISTGTGACEDWRKFVTSSRCAAERLHGWSLLVDVADMPTARTANKFG